MIEPIISSVLAKIIAEAVLKIWGLRVKNENVEITSLSEKINELILEGRIKIPAPDKARLEVEYLEFYLPPPIIPLPPPLPPAPPIPPPPIILPPVSVKLRII
ncbi:MAG: hypothetical protein KKI06_06875, partial [Euryarchaeota archaeon]|nr:hypothetical protein [Euryarchaeota archaeon]